MWIVICFDRSRDCQSNEAVFQSEETLMDFVNMILDTHQDAKIVMVPNASNRVNRKLFPLVTSKNHDFYAQWFD